MCMFVHPDRMEESLSKHMIGDMKTVNKLVMRALQQLHKMHIQPYMQHYIAFNSALLGL